ncbi:ArsR/SmtB family transcription factor [Paractinoplanes lichenicola]|uniref:Winged helix-turn-helix transcriptional regulator n=1 Tax=Paractinoplanes lichenicola TaxID=2802976 RepID=A0ABS1VGS9_9ACTN|nr:winged helix-turn-helix domain-containing protein [Actinoplanes lichenicola]MBL7253878.1 winged helix-turn-helix transcriptional regulator [Actinoplanes lichenicola]
MIRIELDRSATASMRIGVSQFSELVGAVELLSRGRSAVPWPYSQWARHAGAVLDSTAADAPLRVYGRLLAVRARQRTPDVFHPLADSPAPSVEEELEVLCATPRSTIDAQFAEHFPAGAPDWLAGYQRDPARSFTLLAESLFDFWQRALRPFWSRMRSALDEEILRRGRVIATAGPEAVLSDLHGGTRWARPVLSLPKAKESRLAADGRRLLLVPMLFADQRVGCSTDDAAVLRLTYQCRGAAALASEPDRRDVRGPDRMGALLGSRRALILRALTTPATTSGLASGLGLPASTVSEQLAALHGAGVVRKVRAGRQVFYALEPAGRALLEVFEQPGHDSATANRFTA